MSAQPPVAHDQKLVGVDSPERDECVEAGVCVPIGSPVEQQPLQAEPPTKPSSDTSPERIVDALADAGFNKPVHGYVPPPEPRVAWFVAGTIGALLAVALAGTITYRQSKMYPPVPPASAASAEEGKPLPKPSSPSIYDPEPEELTVEVRPTSSGSAVPSPGASSSAQAVQK